MLSQLYWLVPKQVLYWKLAGHITGTEIAEMSRFIAEQVEKSTASKVHILIDTSGIDQIDYQSQEARAAFLILAFLGAGTLPLIDGPGESQLAGDVALDLGTGLGGPCHRR